MATEKWRNCLSGIHLAAIDNISPDVFDPPLDEEQLELYHSIQDTVKKLRAEGKNYVIDIPSEV